MAASSSSLTDAEIDKLTVSKLRKLLDAKEIAYEKKELKAALAAKLKDAMRKEKEGKEEEEEEEEEDSDEEDFDEYEDDGSVEWMLRMHQKIARPKNKRDWEIRESVLSGGGIP
jgi:CRISPR/Cas system-associated exonuclease Cas4 (RecB family)